MNTLRNIDRSGIVGLQQKSYMGGGDNMKRLLVLGVFVCAMLVLVVGPAHAVPTIQLSDGATTVTVADNGVGDSNPTVGEVTYVGAVGATWFINVSTGESKPLLGTAQSPHMDLNSINNSNAAGTLTILWSDTDFTGIGTGQLKVGGTLTSGVGSSVDFFAYYDPANALFALTDLITAEGPFGPGAYSQVKTGAIAGPAPYSLTLESVITHTAAGNTSFNKELQLQVPEPATLLLLGSGVMMLGLLRSRKQ